MALSTSTIAEVESGGSDTANSGLFDPSQTAGMFTDGAATVANTSAPVFTSASYNFVAGDLNAWVYIASGSSWIAGWYQITLVASNAATLNGTIGQAVLATVITPSTVVGCATVAGPTAATWTIDYSQQTAVKQSYTDLASAGTGLTVSSAAHPFGRQQVGNSIVITAVGTNFNLGRYVIASVAAITFVATVVGPTNITTGAGVNGVGALGGCFASPGAASAVLVVQAFMFIKAATYSITSASTNIAGGCVSEAANLLMTEGYSSVRGDLVAGVILQASGISTAVIYTTNANGQGQVRNIVVDGQSLTSIQGFLLNAKSLGYKLGAKNCTNNGYSTTNGNAQLMYCYATGCSTQAAFNAGSSCYGCVAYSNTITGFLQSGTGNSALMDHCISYLNTGASSDGFQSAASASNITSCVAYGNGRDGFRQTGNGVIIANCIAESNTGIGFNIAIAILQNCAAYSNTGGNVVFAGSTLNQQKTINLIIGGSSFFVNAASGNFALNNTASAGASARAAGFPALSADGLTTSYPDIGAAQHQDTPNIFPVFD